MESKFNFGTVMPVFDMSAVNKSLDVVAKANTEKKIRELENNENLKRLAAYDEELVEYNKQLVNLNESILRKINTVSGSMDTVINAIGANAQRLEGNSMEHNKLLLELIEIMEAKEDEEKNKLGGFLKGLTGPVAAGLITGYFKMKLGLS